MGLFLNDGGSLKKLRSFVLSKNHCRWDKKKHGMAMNETPSRSSESPNRNCFAGLDRGGAGI